MTSKSRTLIKLDDKIIEITKGTAGLEARELPEDEQFEVSVLGEGVDSLIQNDINRLTNEAYEELKQDFKNNLKANVLGILGFEKKWGATWEVDHCNGRASTVTQYISHKLQVIVQQELEKLIGSLEIGEILKETKKGLRTELQKEFNRHVRDETYSAARSQAKTFVAEEMKKSIKRFQKQAIEKAEIALLGRKARLTPVSEKEDIKL